MYLKETSKVGYSTPEEIVQAAKENDAVGCICRELLEMCDYLGVPCPNFGLIDWPVRSEDGTVYYGKACDESNIQNGHRTIFVAKKDGFGVYLTDRQMVGIMAHELRHLQQAENGKELVPLTSEASLNDRDEIDADAFGVFWLMRKGETPEKAMEYVCEDLNEAQEAYKVRVEQAKKMLEVKPTVYQRILASLRRFAGWLG